LIVSTILIARSPTVLKSGIAGVEGAFTYFIPVFLCLVLLGMILNVKSAPFALRLVLKVLLILSCLFLLLIEIEFLADGQFEVLMVKNLGTFLFAMSLLLFLNVFLFAVTRKMAVAVRMTTALTFLYAFTNYFVLAFRGTPFHPLDVFAVKTAVDVATGYKFTITPPLIGSGLVFVGVFFVAAKAELPKINVKKLWGIRCVAFIVSVVFLFVVTSKTVIESFPSLKPNYWNQKISSVQNGSIVNFVSNIHYSQTSTPNEYSMETVNRIAEQYVSDYATDMGERPDVILILGESWADLAPAETVVTDRVITPYLNSFKEKENSVYGNLVVTSMGGGTSVSEFQALAGVSSEYGLYPAPFQYYVKTVFPNITDSFKRLGYQTVALHTGTIEAWGRNKAFPLMGFDKFLSEEELKTFDSRYLRHYMSDEVMYDEILSVLDHAEEPQFIYGITIQVHGGYEYDLYESKIKLLGPEGNYPREEQYLSLMYESDKDFGAFMDKLEERERPTLVLAFGDHLPSMDQDYLETILSHRGELWAYTTFYAMWANYELPEGNSQPPEYMSINYLGTYLMKSANLPLTGYQKFLTDGMSKYPVISLVGLMDIQNNLISGEEAFSADVYISQQIMQHNLLQDKKNYPQDFYTLK